MRLTIRVGIRGKTKKQRCGCDRFVCFHRSGALSNIASFRRRRGMAVRRCLRPWVRAPSARRQPTSRERLQGCWASRGRAGPCSPGSPAFASGDTRAGLLPPLLGLCVRLPVPLFRPSPVLQGDHGRDGNVIARGWDPRTGLNHVRTCIRCQGCSESWGQWLITGTSDGAEGTLPDGPTAGRAGRSARATATTMAMRKQTSSS